MALTYADCYRDLVTDRPDQWVEGVDQLKLRQVHNTNQLPEKEDQELEKIKLEYSNLMSSTALLFESDDSFTDEYYESRNEFENDFVTLNCEVQNHRSDFHHARDAHFFAQKQKEVR